MLLILSIINNYIAFVLEAFVSKLDKAELTIELCGSLPRIVVDSARSKCKTRQPSLI